MKNKWFSFVGLLILSKSAFALESAVGLSGVWMVRSDGPTDSFKQFAPEVVGYIYNPLPSHFSFRSALRFSYAWQQPEMPKAVRVNEFDFRFGGETGIVWNWIVSPSLTFGGGGIYRRIELATAPPISVKSDGVSETQVLPFIQGQFGLGIPIEKGVVVLEPYVRYMKVFGDDRYGWNFGAEATVTIF